MDREEIVSWIQHYENEICDLKEILKEYDQGCIIDQNHGHNLTFIKFQEKVIKYE